MPDSTQKNYTNGADNTPSGFTGNTDRATGEYRYKSGYTQKIYSDAKFSPASESTVPPKYYVPSRKAGETAANTDSKKSPVPPAEGKKRRGGRVIGTVALCLVFSILGGVIGTCLTEFRLSGKLDDISDKIEAFAGNSEKSILGGKFSFSTGEESRNAPELPVDEKDEMPEAVMDFVAPAPTPAIGMASVSASASQELSSSDIYDAACSQVVGITTEVTYTNFFGQTSSSAVSGSGFVITDDGKVLTNYHVIEYAYRYGYSISVVLHDGTAYEAEIVGIDADNDLAVLSIRAAGLVPANLGDSDSIRVGESAYAVGNPLGELEFTMTSGTVSGLDRLIASDSTGAAINMFQIDATVNTGNSGGPVYNSRGQVIGVVTAKYSSNGVEGIGFAIPINDAKRVAGDIIQNGYVTGKAYLGVYYDENNSSVYNYYYHDLWGSPAGVLVLQVEKGSCAEKAGIKSYDTVTAVGEYTVESGADLVNALRKYSAGDTVDITVYRAGEGYSTGKTIVFTVTFDEAVPGRSYSNMSEA